MKGVRVVKLVTRQIYILAAQVRLPPGITNKGKKYIINKTKNHLEYLKK